VRQNRQATYEQKEKNSRLQHRKAAAPPFAVSSLLWPGISILKISRSPDASHRRHAPGHCSRAVLTLLDTAPAADAVTLRRPWRAGICCTTACYPDHLPNVPCPLPRWIGTGACVGCFPIPRGLPRQKGGSASTNSLSRPAQTSLALRPAGSLDRPRRPLSRGFASPTTFSFASQMKKLPPSSLRFISWMMDEANRNETSSTTTLLHSKPV